MAVNAESKQTTRKPRQVCQGVVLRDSRDKTIKVAVQRLVKHPRYGKYLHRRTAVQVHDEKNEGRVGDVVEIMESRPVSKTKSWRLVRVLRRSEGAATGTAESKV